MTLGDRIRYTNDQRLIIKAHLCSLYIRNRYIRVNHISIAAHIFSCVLHLAWSLSNATNRRRRLESQRSHTDLHFSSVTVRSSPSCSVVTVCLCARRSYFIHTCINSHNLSSKSSTIFKTLPLVLCLCLAWTMSTLPHCPPTTTRGTAPLGPCLLAFRKQEEIWTKWTDRRLRPYVYAYLMLSINEP